MHPGHWPSLPAAPVPETMASQCRCPLLARMLRCTTLCRANHFGVHIAACTCAGGERTAPLQKPR